MLFLSRPLDFSFDNYFKYIASISDIKILKVYGSSSLFQAIVFEIEYSGIVLYFIPKIYLMIKMTKNLNVCEEVKFNKKGKNPFFIELNA